MASKKDNNRYTSKQIQFVMDLIINGYSFHEIVNKFNKKYTTQINYVIARKIFRSHGDKYDLSDRYTPQDRLNSKVKERAIKGYYQYVIKNNKRPSINKLSTLKVIDKSTLSRVFGNIIKFEKAVLDVYPNVFDKVVDERIMTPARFEIIKEATTGSNRFFITAAVTGKPIFKKALRSLRTWEHETGGVSLFMPCSDPASGGGEAKWSLPSELSDSHIVFKDLSLNNNLTLSSIKLQAKQINPLSGLDRLVRKMGSIILASPKQTLKHISDFDERITRAIMTTGAITENDYGTEKYMSERTGYLAANDHVFGGIIVELEKDGSFHFRQVQFEPKTGAFIDLDTKYHANGTTTDNRVSLVRCGDYHCGETDPAMKKALKEVATKYKPEYLLIEDFNNGHSVSPWDTQKRISKAIKQEENLASLEEEFKLMTKEAKFLDSLDFDEIVFIRDNHSLFLERYLEACKFAEDYPNLIMGLKLGLALAEGWNVTKYGIQELNEFYSEKFRFLAKDESFSPNGIENSIHGHVFRGRKGPSVITLDVAYGAVNVGHDHSAAIYRNVFRCGTMTYLTSDHVKYLEGASNWTHSMIFEHNNGSRQIVNFIKGKHRITK